MPFGGVVKLILFQLFAGLSVTIRCRVFRLVGHVSCQIYRGIIMNTLYSSLLLRLIHLHIASLSCQTITPHLNDNLQKGNKKFICSWIEMQRFK